MIRSTYSGVRSVLGALVVLYLAWTLGHALDEAETSNYLSSLLKTEEPTWILPSLSFLLAAVISFSTGSSFGTMGILIPIILPLSVPLQREMDDFIFFLAPVRFWRVLHWEITCHPFPIRLCCPLQAREPVL